MKDYVLEDGAYVSEDGEVILAEDLAHSSPPMAQEDKADFRRAVRKFMAYHYLTEDLELVPNRVLVENHIRTMPSYIENLRTNGKWQEGIVLIGTVKEMNIRDENTPVLVERRGGKEVSGPSNKLKFILRDDTGTIRCSIGRMDFARLGGRVIRQVKVNKTVVAIKGTLCPDMMILCVKRIRVLGGDNR